MLNLIWVIYPSDWKLKSRTGAELSWSCNCFNWVTTHITITPLAERTAIFMKLWSVLINFLLLNGSRVHKIILPWKFQAAAVRLRMFVDSWSFVNNKKFVRLNKQHSSKSWSIRRSPKRIYLLIKFYYEINHLTIYRRLSHDGLLNESKKRIN